MANKTNTTTKTTATKNAKNDSVKLGKELQATQAKKSEFELAYENATKKLSMALAWRLKMSTHYVVMPNNKTVKYIGIDSGMPRDVSVILVEGKDHNIAVKFKTKDTKHDTGKKGGLNEDEQSYNDNVDKWEKACGREAKARIEKVLKDCKGFDDLWALVALLERNEEIKKAQKFF